MQARARLAVARRALAEAEAELAAVLASGAEGDERRLAVSTFTWRIDAIACTHEGELLARIPEDPCVATQAHLQREARRGKQLLASLPHARRCR